MLNRYLLATRPEIITQVLGIVYRAISGNLIRQAGLTRASAATSAVTLIQRLGSALNLNVHSHLLVLAGVYRRSGEGRREAVGHRDVPDATCRQCDGWLRVIVSIEQTAVIERILAPSPGGITRS